MTHTCDECRQPFTAKRDHARFCSKACNNAYSNRHLKQGYQLVTLAKAAQATKHAKPGTRDAEICRYARAEAARMIRDYLDDDMAFDRDIVEVVGAMMDAGEQYTDRQQAKERPLEKRKAAFETELSDMGHNMLAATLHDLRAMPIKPRSFQAWQVRAASIATNQAARIARRKSRMAA